MYKILIRDSLTVGLLATFIAFWTESTNARASTLLRTQFVCHPSGNPGWATFDVFPKSRDRMSEIIVSLSVYADDTIDANHVTVTKKSYDWQDQFNILSNGPINPEHYPSFGRPSSYRWVGQLKPNNSITMVGTLVILANGTGEYREQINGYDVTFAPNCELEFNDKEVK